MKNIYKNLYKNRLLLLAEHLEKLPNKRFDFRHWVGPDWNGDANLCNTTACALGHATTIPELADAGLILVKCHSYRHGGLVCLRQNMEVPEFDIDNISSLDAAMHVFGLTMDEAEYLFLPASECMIDMWGVEGLEADATPKQVANHIRFFVDKKYNIPDDVA